MLNHDKTEIHRTSLTLKRIKQECMSFSKNKIVIRPVTLLCWDPGQSWQMLSYDWPVCVRRRNLENVVVKNVPTEEEEEDVTLCRAERSAIEQQSDLNILLYCIVSDVNVDTGAAE